MPRAMLGVPGFNPFNILIFFILVAWLFQKDREGLKWEVPQRFNSLLILYLLIVFVSLVRMVGDVEGLVAHAQYFNLPHQSITELIRDDFFNSWKFLIPGLLICHGVSTKERGYLAIQCILITGLLLGLQIILRMWPALLGMDDLHRRSMRVFDRDIGYHKVELAYFMASCAWGCVIYATSSIQKKNQLLGIAGFGFATLALLATGGRGGAVAWAICALVLGVVKWHKILVIGPLCLLIGLFIIPSAGERYFSGFSSDSYESGMAERLDTINSEGFDEYAITSGRVIVWPRVISKIREASVFGFGKRAYEREGIFESLHDDGILPLGAGFWHHPHSAYLMVLLDMGLVGGVIVAAFFCRLLWSAIAIFRKSDDRMYQRTTAGFLLAFMVVGLINGLFAGTFYPAQENMLQWCSIGLFLGMIGRNYDTIQQ